MECVSMVVKKMEHFKLIIPLSIYLFEVNSLEFWL